MADNILNGAVKAIGSIVAGIERETALMALSVVTLQHIVNSSDDRKHAEELAARFATTMRESVSEAFEKGFGK